MSIEDRQSEVWERFDQNRSKLSQNDVNKIKKLFNEFHEIYESDDDGFSPLGGDLDDVLDEIEDIINKAESV